MGEDPGRIQELLDVVFSYGPGWVYAAVFVACFIENLIPPFPGDSFIVAAGGLVAAQRLALLPAALVVLAGGMSSVMVLYIFGRYYGRDYFIKRDFKYLPADDIYAAERQFASKGWIILIVSRFVVGFRAALALVAGISKYSSINTALFSLVSYVLFGGLLMLLGYQLVENFERIAYYFRTYNLVIWPILIIILVYLILRQIKKARKARG